MKQREIKFRAWDKKNKKFYPFSFGTIYGYEGEVCGVLTGENGRYGGVEINFNSGYGFNGINPDIEIVEFTGLHDKNGKEIYEGDVVRWDDGSNGAYWRIAEVFWDNGAALFAFRIIDCINCRIEKGYVFGSNFMYRDGNELETIGNLYENPELIKETR